MSHCWFSVRCCAFLFINDGHCQPCYYEKLRTIINQIRLMENVSVWMYVVKGFFGHEEMRQLISESTCS